MIFVYSYGASIYRPETEDRIHHIVPISTGMYAIVNDNRIHYCPEWRWLPGRLEKTKKKQVFLYSGSPKVIPIQFFEFPGFKFSLTISEWI